MADLLSSPTLRTLLRLLPILFAAGLFLYQLRSLYYAPRPDCDRWHGDETWLMSEFKAQVSDGIFHYPEAIGSTIADHNTLPVGSMWLNAIVYGVPAVIVGGDRVVVGRTITAGLALVLLLSILKFARRLGAHTDITGLLTLALVASQTFYLSSHSARYDILVGLGVLFAWYATVRRDAIRLAMQENYWYALGAVLPAMMIWNIHVLRIAGPLVLYAFIVQQGWKERRILKVIAGGALPTLVLGLVYWFTVGSLHDALSLPANSQFEQVTRSLPLLHPFGVQLQFANIQLRLEQWAREAAAFFVILLVSLAVAVLDRKRPVASSERLLIPMLIVVASWTLTMRPLPYYDLHILPVLAVMCAILLTRILTEWNGVFRTLTIGMAALTIVVIGLRDTRIAQANGEYVTRSVNKVYHNILSEIRGQAAGARPIVVAEVPMISNFLQAKDLDFISPYWLIFPKDTLTPPQFLQKHQVDFVVVEGSRLRLPSGFALGATGYDADSSGILVSQFVGTFNDNHVSYFRPFLGHRDTISLFRVGHFAAEGYPMK